MKRTFTTIMPDKVGAFLTASRIFSSLGLNITRVSYNKAVDTHMLFIEAQGDESAMDMAEAQLKETGYLPDNENTGNVMLIEFRLRDVPGEVQKVLELINNYNINISYLSSQENGTEYQYFRMGLFVQDHDDIAELLKSASQLCGVKIINYNPTGVALDNTVFYVSFANKIAEENGLSDSEKRSLIIDSNLIMDMLTRKNSPPYKTFEYIGKFAENLTAFHGEAFQPRITAYELDGARLTLMEPLCGSNVAVIQTGFGMVLVDGGFPCYNEESTVCLERILPGFKDADKQMLLTHADVDHVGLAWLCSRVYASRKCCDNFEKELSGQPNLREENPAHAPYVRISKLLSHYKTVPPEKVAVIGGVSEEIDGLTEYIGQVKLHGLCFDAYEARGGHVRGETVYIERRLRILFTGDIIVNTKGFTRPQAAFNRLAPFLMTSVDTDPKLAADERDAVLKLLDSGEWTIFGGHGAPMTITI